MFNFDLTKTKYDKLFEIIISISAFFIPGFAYIYLYDSNLFVSTDFNKLIIISLFYSLPLILLCAIKEIFLNGKKISEDNVYNALISTILIVYFSVLLKYLLVLLGKNINILFLALFGYIYLVLENIWMRKKEIFN